MRRWLLPPLAALLLEEGRGAESRRLITGVYAGYVEGVLPDIKKWFESYYTIQFANYPVDEHYLAHGGTRVACTPGRAR